MGASKSLRTDIVVRELKRAPPYFIQRAQHSVFVAQPKILKRVTLSSKPPIAHLFPLRSSFKVYAFRLKIESFTFLRISLRQLLNLYYGHCLMTPSKLAYAEIGCDGTV